MADQLYDVIVIGGGIEGSATAYQLSQREGVRVLLLEQFPLPHSRGSSHGQTRVIRKAYTDEFYTDMMKYCNEQWRHIQKETNQVLFKNIGFLAIGEMEGSFLKETMESMDMHSAEYSILTPREFKKAYPNLKYDGDWGGVADPSGGILMADKALRSLQHLFTKHGGIIHDGEPVVKIDPGNIAQITTSKNKYRAKSVVLCCGPWTNRLLKSLKMTLPLEPVRINVCYWAEKVPGTYSADKFPTFFDMTVPEREVYGLPSEEYPGHVKLCLHHGPSVDPDRRDAVDSQWVLDLAKKYVKEHFPGLKSEPSVVESCIYTNTPDKNFILDHHPFWKNIIIGAGFSGHGFKLSPAVGQILADLAMNLTPEYDISHFRIERFGYNQVQASL